MFIFDVETLGKQSNSVILSFACVYFDPDADINHSEMRKDAFFAKLSVAEQMKVYCRTSQKSTIEWWSKQCENVRLKSFKPSAADEEFIPAYERFRAWAKSKNDSKCWVWARGNLDQLVMDDVEEQLKLEPVFRYERWRDVRTAIDFLYGTTNGYTKIDTPPWVEPFNPELHITKHNPVDDCIFDAMMLKYGAKND